MSKHIEITDNLKYLEEFLLEAFIKHRNFYKKWSNITHQTPTVKSGYLSQHLASLITGVRGSFSGARGDDLKDGTEVKACTKIDQQDSCKDCKASLPRYVLACLFCNSTNIKRNNDSKWLFSIKNEEDLDLLVSKIPRVLLLLFDYPDFESGNFDLIEIKSYEIIISDDRCIKFKEMMVDYYENVYLEHKKENANKVPASKNLFPYSYAFYLCNPILTFHAQIDNGTLKVLKYIEPQKNRSSLDAENMPISLLSKNEKALFSDVDSKYLDESQRLKLSIRPSKKFELKTKHSRGSQT